ncbi:LysR family transcriptional regulator [Paraburkholderia unamae]|uniref:DNA-binding transcriptional LysR family regulator n=1 Tax=Paraburkholderia unamae TaxID=219649 RepID=A0ABX5KSP1_9BURK|nr:LysR family transcriptional regulator [Paraburkholderia unamae]PVX85859.1 DNA-binding transcriptional LysR family regulator [Paraburkholderia unamae]
MAISDLNLVRVFIAIYEAGSVSAAARRLNITQPSVSYSLGRLRDLLNDELFTRTREGMAPTFNASQLYTAFSSALNDIERAIVATRDFIPEQSSRCFRLALSDLGEHYLLPLLVRELQQVAPEINLEVVQLDSARVGDWLSTGTVDAVVGNLQFIGGLARKRTLFSETYSCILSASHPRIGMKLSLDEYVAEKHVVVDPHSGHHLVEDVLTEMGLTRRTAIRVPHFTNPIGVIASTDFLLTLPTRVARAVAEDGRVRILPLPLPIPNFDVNLYWQSRADDTTAQHWFCEVIARALSAA